MGHDLPFIFVYITIYNQIHLPVRCPSKAHLYTFTLQLEYSTQNFILLFVNV